MNWHIVKYRHSSIYAVSISAILDLTRFTIQSRLWFQSRLGGSALQVKVLLILPQLCTVFSYLVGSKSFGDFYDNSDRECAHQNKKTLYFTMRLLCWKLLAHGFAQCWELAHGSAFTLLRLYGSSGLIRQNKETLLRNRVSFCYESPIKFESHLKG